MNDRLLALRPYPMEELARRKAALLEEGVAVFDFGTGDPIEPTPAFIRRAFLDGVPEISQYPPIGGLPEMRRAASGYLRRRFGVDLAPDTQILPTQGSKEAIFHLPMTFLDPSRSARDTVVYGVPAYPVLEIGALFADARVHEVLLAVDNRYSMDPADIGADVLERAALVFLNYPHNPTGQLLPPALFEAWVAARAHHGFVLVSDECYADLWYEDEVPRSLLEFGTTGCLAVHSLSKRSGMTGYRSGFVAGDPELVARYQRFRAGMGVAPSVPAQAAAVVAWSDPDHVAARCRVFKDKRLVFLQLFSELGLEVYNGPSTLFLWVNTPKGVGDSEYVDRLLDRGIIASPGSFFGPGQEAFFRLALVPDLAACKRAAELWPR